MDRLVHSGEYSGMYRIGSGKEYGPTSFYVVTAYPADEVEDGTLLKNSCKAVLHPTGSDKEDIEKVASARYSYQSYKWNYNGDYTSIGHNYGGETYVNGTGWTTVYGLRKGTGEDLGGIQYTVTGNARIFNTTHYLDSTEGVPGEYRDGAYAEVTTAQDALCLERYTAETGWNYSALGPDDYYYSSVTVTQSDINYDINEDEESRELVPEENTEGIDRGLYIYAWYEDGVEYEPVAKVDWDTSGSMTYTFSQDQLSRHPWRVMAVHNAVDYSSAAKIQVRVMIRSDSTLFGELEEDNTAHIVNLLGIICRAYGGTENETLIDYQNYSSSYIDTSFSETVYGSQLERTTHYGYLSALPKHAGTNMTASVSNDSANGRVRLDYMVEGFEGYQVGSREVLNEIRESGYQLNRGEVAIYTLLPRGVQFDPSAPITVGRVTSSDSGLMSEEQVTLTRYEITEDYLKTGRTRVEVHIAYTGEDPSVLYDTNKRLGSVPNLYWMCGYGVRFRAYSSYKEFESTVKASSSIAAYMPEDGTSELVASSAEGYMDNGYEELGVDINGDEITNVKNVLHARAYVSGRVTIATSISYVEKLVREDANRFGRFDTVAAVEPGKGYTYSLSLNFNDWNSYHPVIFDRLEANGSEENSWKGTFEGIDVSRLISAGISPTVYYSMSEEAALPDGTELIGELLTEENGWIPAANWNEELSSVRAVTVDYGVDYRNYATNNSYNKSAFLIHMTAPEEMDENQIWVANSPYIYYEKWTYLSIRKKILYNVTDPDTAALANEKTFEMTLSVKEREEDEYIPASGISYQIQDTNGNTVEDGLVTGEDGIFYLKADQTALFERAGNEGTYWSVTETMDPVFQQLSPVSEEAEDGKGTPVEGIFSKTVGYGEITNGEKDLLIIRKNFALEEDQELSYQAAELMKKIKMIFHVEIDRKDGAGFVALSPADNLKVVRVTIPDNQDFTAITSEDYEELTAITDGNLEMDSRTMYLVIPQDVEGYEEWEYRVRETQTSSENNPLVTEEGVTRWYPYSYYKYVRDPNSYYGTYYTFTYNGNYLVMNNGVEEVVQESSWKKQNLIMLENTLYDFRTLNNKDRGNDSGNDIHAVNENWSAIGRGNGKITFRVTQYQNGQWQAAEGIPYYFADANGKPISDLLLTGSDGLITFVSDGVNNVHMYFGKTIFIEDIVRSKSGDTDRYTYDENDNYIAYPLMTTYWKDCLLIDEVPEMTDETCGTLVGYPRTGTNLSTYSTENWSAGSYIYRYSADSYRTFLHSDTLRTIELQADVNVRTTKSFTFRLEQYERLFYASSSYFGNIKPGADLSYVIYDARSGAEVTRGTTNAAGEFAIQGGQYVRISVPTQTRWKITELDPYPYRLRYISGYYRDNNNSIRYYTIGEGYSEKEGGGTQTNTRNYAYVYVY